MDAGAIKAGQAYVELISTDEKLQGGLRAAEQKLKAFSSGLSSIGAPSPPWVSASPPRSAR